MEGRVEVGLEVEGERVEDGKEGKKTYQSHWLYSSSSVLLPPNSRCVDFDRVSPKSVVVLL